MSASTIDYDALAQQHGGTAAPAVDYDALASQHGGAAIEGHGASGSWEEPGVISKAWNSVTAPIGSHFEGYNQETQKLHGIANGPPTPFDEQHPVKSFIRRSLAGMEADAADQLTPLFAATAGAGAAAKAPGAVGTIARTVLPVASVGFAGQGAASVVNNAPAAMHGDPNAVGQVLGGLGAIAGGAAGIGPTAKTVAQVRPLKGALAGKMAEVPAGEQFSRGEVVDAAQQHGVNLDVAQATDSTVAHAVKKVNQYSLAGRGAYENAQAKNVNALEAWADAEASKYSPNPADREIVGKQVQEALQNDLAQRKAAATQAYQQLDQSVGKLPVDVTDSVQAEAQKIINQNKGYYDRHPELQPKQAWNILQDLANKEVASKAQPASGLLDARGNPYPGKPAVMASDKSMSWSELHQLRSDLMDVYRNNPDVIKGRSEAWLQQMVSKIDDSMTGAGSGLTGSDLETFRRANSEWEGLKSTYDNPQSPLYHAVRAPFSSKVPQMLSGTPELARQVRQTIGSLEGPFQRQFVENLLNNKAGQLDLKNLNSRLSRTPQDVLESMVGQDGARNLRLLGKVSQKVTADANPSGTAKASVPSSEVTGGAAAIVSNPAIGVPAAAAYHGTQYGLGKAMNSPSFLEYLSKR